MKEESPVLQAGECQYLLTERSGAIQCPCPQAQHRGMCAHVAAVRLAMQRREPPGTRGARVEQTKPAVSQSPRPEHSSSSRSEQERRLQAEAERRERALLWTDDQPFSIWKS